MKVQEPTRTDRLLRVAGTIAAVAGIASWWTGYWDGLAAALAGLVLASIVVRWSQRRHCGVRGRRGLPTVLLLLALVGGCAYVFLAVVRSRGAGVALGVSTMMLAWSTISRPDAVDEGARADGLHS